MKINSFFNIIGKFLRWPLYLCLGLAVLLVCAQISLKYFLPMQSIQQKIVAVISQAVNADVRIDSFSAGLTGIQVKDIQINSIEGHVIANLKNAEVKINLLKLLKWDIDLKRIYIDKLDLFIVKNEDGSFNIDNLFVSKEPDAGQDKEENTDPLDLYIKICQIKQGMIVYTDKQSGAETVLDDVFFDLENFSFDGPFRLSVRAKASYKETASKTDVQDISFGFTLYPDLKNLDLRQALADIKLIIIERGNSDIILNGKVNNFTNPQADVSVTVKNFSGETLQGLGEVPDFNIAKAVLAFKANYNADLQKITADKLTLNISDASFPSVKQKLAADKISLVFKGTADLTKQIFKADNLVLQTDNAKFSADKFSFNPLKSVLVFEGGYDVKQENFSAEKLNFEIADTKLSLNGNNSSVEKAVLNFKGSYRNNNKNLTADMLNFESGQSQISAKGWFKSGKKSSYDLEISLNTLLAEITPFYPELQPYKLNGEIKAELALSNKNAKGKISLKHGSGYYEKAGTFNNINSSLDIASLKDISLHSLTGSLNGNPFKAALTYKEKGNKGNVNIAFSADKILIEDKTAVITQYSPEDTPVLDEDIAVPEKVAEEWFLPPLNIKGNIEIGTLDMPFLKASSVTLHTDLNNFTADLDKVGGIMTLNTRNGIIKDLHKLTNSSAITKVLFLSLSVVSKVINSLDVLSVLNKISKTVIPLGKDDHKTEKIEGALPYEYFDINLDFANGLTDIKKGNFVSDLLSFDLSGEINLINRKIDMNVDAAPGKHEKGGIMPLRLKIGGTIDNPSGSMSMLSSAVNLLGQGVFNNAGSRIIKKGVGGVLGAVGIGGQSKKEQEETQQDEFVPFEIIETQNENTEQTATGENKAANNQDSSTVKN